MTVESIRLRLWLIGPIRLLLGIVFLAASRAVGGSSSGTFVAFAAAALAMAFLIPNDPRARLRRDHDEPAELPPDVRVAPAWQHAVHAALPSTVGVTILAAVVLPFRPTLAALLAGILAGLGLAALYAAYGFDERLYLEPRQHLVFRR